MTELLELFIADNISTIDFFDCDCEETAIFKFEDKETAMEFAERLENEDNKTIASFEFDSDKNSLVINYTQGE